MDLARWWQWQRVAQKLRTASSQEVREMQRRADQHMRGLERCTLVTAAARFGIMYPHALTTPLLRVALNPFYPWVHDVPVTVSDVALDRLASKVNGNGHVGQAKDQIEQGIVTVQNRLAEQNRAGAFEAFRALKAPAHLLTVHAWEHQLLDVVSHLGTLLLSPTGALPPFLVSYMARDVGGPMIRLRCPACRRILTPQGVCREHGQQRAFTVWVASA